MKRSFSNSYPVVSLLSPSPLASRKAQELFSSIFGLQANEESLPEEDFLDETFKSRLPGLSQRWDSVTLKCNSSGAVLHFCSLISGRENEKMGPFSLLALTDAPGTYSTREAVHDFRKKLAFHLKEGVTSTKLRYLVGLPLSVSDLLGSISNAGLPLLEIPESKDGTQLSENTYFCGLKEITIPAFDYAQYMDGSNLLSRLSNSGLKRAKTGLYQWPGGHTRIRPLPTAPADQQLPPPSFVFHCTSLECVADKLKCSGATGAKIGFGGKGLGQMIILHPHLAGLDLRYCAKTELSSSFAEAQESLLAGSIAELQSSNVLPDHDSADDKRLGKSDCWIEVRANIKHPAGFLRRSKSRSALNQRLPIKAPDLPYE